MKKDKLFKSRLSNFFAYEWIMLLVVAVVGIILWELVYSIASIKPTVGQHFKYYYDYGVYAEGSGSIHKLLKDNDAFSFDVLKADYETILQDTDVLSTRLSIGEGDAIFTETTPKFAADKFDQEKDKYNSNRANYHIDHQLYSDYKIYDFDRLVKESKEYLKTLLKDGKTGETDMLNFDNLDPVKIKAGFDERLSGDNRFRSAEEKVKGVEQEGERLKKLCEDTAYLIKVLDKDDELMQSLNADESHKNDADYKANYENYLSQSMFYRYTAGEQSYALAESEKSQKDWKYLLDLEAEKGRVNARYGLRLDKFETTDDADREVDKYIQLRNGTDSEPTKHLVLLIYDFYKDQGVLQFETVTFTAEFIKLFSSQFD